MRPDKKKKNRGKYVDKSADSQAQGKSEVTGVPVKEEPPKPSAGESSIKNQDETADKDKSATTSPPEKEAKTENLPPANLKRETDALKETKKPSKRQIFSDWKEYDQPILPEEIEEEQFRNFSSLIQQNISDDNYFKFKHERQWENESCNINKDLFNLNLQELSEGLQCIPYYERLNISMDYFSEHEVKRMQNCAKEQEKIYEEILNSPDSKQIYHAVIEILTKDPAVQSGKSDEFAVENPISNSVSNGRNALSESESVECLGSEKLDSTDKISLIQPEESMGDELQFDFFKNDGKNIVEDISRINNSLENKSQPAEKENREIVEANAISTSTSVHEAVIKDESKEGITEPIEKPLDDIPTEAGGAESNASDMTTVLESAPLGQRVKPQRSRESRNKGKSKVVSSGEEEKILDSLLSLKEPTIVAAETGKEKEMDEVENEADGLTNDLKSIVIHDKEENLEAWLDSMLDD